MVILGGTLGLVAGAAVAGVTPALVVLLGALSVGVVFVGAVQPLPAVTTALLPLLAIVSNLPAPLTIGGRNLRYVFMVTPILLSLWGLRAWRSGRWIPLPHGMALGGLLGAFALATVVRAPDLGAGLGTVALLTLCLAVYAMTAWALVEGGTEEVARVVRWLGVGVALYVGSGVLIVLGHWLGLLPPGFAVETRQVADVALADVGGRLVTPRGFWTVTGSYFAAAAVLGTGLTMTAGPALRPAALIGLIGGLTGMIMSASRGALVGLVVGLAALLVLVGRGRLMRQVVRLGAIVMVAAVPAGVYTALSAGARAAALGRLATLFDLQAGTTVDRLVLWGWMLNDVRERPILGSGAEAYRVYRDPGYPAESFPIEILHSAGLIGFTCFVVWVLAIVRRTWRAVPERMPVTISAVAAFVGLNAAVATNPGGWGTFYWVLAGLAAAAAAVENRRT
jgi:hypothetical protein